MDLRKLSTQIEALLFALGKPLSRSELAKMLDVSADEVSAAVAHLLEAAKAGDRGMILVDDGREVELRTAPEASELVARVRRDEFGRDLGRAGAEVIAILLYAGPSTRAAIDFIRGVNSSAALRTLSMRGLVRKSPLQAERSLSYELTSELLAALGTQSAAGAPEYEAVRRKLESLERERGE